MSFSPWRPQTRGHFPHIPTWWFFYLIHGPTQSTPYQAQATPKDAAGSAKHRDGSQKANKMDRKMVRVTFPNLAVA